MLNKTFVGILWFTYAYATRQKNDEQWKRRLEFVFISFKFNSDDDDDDGELLF